MLTSLPRTLAILTCGVALLSQGCSGVECGAGTVERGGDCVLADTPPAQCACGTGAHYDDGLQVCLPDHVPAVCNPETTVELVDDDGVTTCKGDCSGGCPPACPWPAAGHVTICGELIDLETNARIEASGLGTGARCDELPPEERSGPCLLDVGISDGLELPGTDPIEVRVDDCGYYAAVNIPTPELGYVSITVDDAADSPNEDWAATVVTFAVSSGERHAQVNTYALRHSTDVAWTVSAGEPFGGQTFSERGALALIFLRGDFPISDVQILRSPGGLDPDTDYYFSDNDETVRTTIDPAQDVTGRNGTGLVVDSPLVEHGGTGGLPEPCVWPSALASSPPGFLQVSERHAELLGGGACP